MFLSEIMAAGNVGPLTGTTTTSSCSNPPDQELVLGVVTILRTARRRKVSWRPYYAQITDFMAS